MGEAETKLGTDEPHISPPLSGPSGRIQKAALSLQGNNPWTLSGRKVELDFTDITVALCRSRLKYA